MKLSKLFGRKSARATVVDARAPVTVSAAPATSEAPKLITYMAKPPSLTKKQRKLVEKEMRCAAAAERAPSVAESMYMKTPSQFAAKFKIPDAQDHLMAVSVPARVNAQTIGQLSIPLEGYQTATEKVQIQSEAKGRVLVDANSRIEPEREFKLPPPAMAAHKEPTAVPVIIGRAVVPSEQVADADNANGTILMPVQLALSEH